MQQVQNRGGRSAGEGHQILALSWGVDAVFPRKEPSRLGRIESRVSATPPLGRRKGISGRRRRISASLKPVSASRKRISGTVQRVCGSQIDLGAAQTPLWVARTALAVAGARKDRSNFCLARIFSIRYIGISALMRYVSESP